MAEALAAAPVRLVVTRWRCPLWALRSVALCIRFAAVGSSAWGASRPMLKPVRAPLEVARA
jgi:hypothetical protein